MTLTNYYAAKDFSSFDPHYSRTYWKAGIVTSGWCAYMRQLEFIKQGCCWVLVPRLGDPGDICCCTPVHPNHTTDLCTGHIRKRNFIHILLYGSREHCFSRVKQRCTCDRIDFSLHAYTHRVPWLFRVILERHKNIVCCLSGELWCAVRAMQSSSTTRFVPKIHFLCVLVGSDYSHKVNGN